MFWAGFQVLLGEVNAGLSTTQVVVKELKASASVQEQMQFLEEVQPYRYSQFLSSVLPHLILPTAFSLLCHYISLGGKKFNNINDSSYLKCITTQFLV